MQPFSLTQQLQYKTGPFKQRKATCQVVFPVAPGIVMPVLIRDAATGNYLPSKAALYFNELSDKKIQVSYVDPDTGQAVKAAISPNCTASASNFGSSPITIKLLSSPQPQTLTCAVKYPALLQLPVLAWSKTKRSYVVVQATLDVNAAANAKVSFQVLEPRPAPQPYARVLQRLHPNCSAELKQFKPFSPTAPLAAYGFVRGDERPSF